MSRSWELVASLRYHGIRDALLNCGREHTHIAFMYQSIENGIAIPVAWEAILSGEHVVSCTTLRT
jgi:hypothetical protein